MTDTKLRPGNDDAERRKPRSNATMLVLGCLGALIFVGFLALGIWQIERLAWKNELVVRIGERVIASPVKVPAPAQWAGISTDADEYRHVTLSGRFDNSRETLVQAVTTSGAGFWVMTPLTTSEGFTVLVNRGFVPSDKRDPSKRAAGQIDGQTSVTGLLRISEPEGGFLRANDPAAKRWFSRDVAAIATALGLADAAPFFVDADTTPNSGGLPIGGLTIISFTNNHLIYAVTWLALACMILGATIFVFQDEKKVRLALVE